jgi:hypothetical protein
MMLKLNFHALARTAIVSGLVVAGIGAFVAASSEPAMALCKYGTPHCINKHPVPTVATNNGVQIPDSGWVDPDCKYYPGLCGSSEVKGLARRHPQTAPSNHLPTANRAPKK